MTETLQPRQRQDYSAGPSCPLPAAEMQPMQDAIAYVREYARQKPDMAALWCFGIGFVLGWKLKPW